MKITTLIIVVVLTFALLPIPASADTEDTLDFVWLIIEPGGRPGGIGKTFTGIADTPDAAYYNCGGLALLPRNGVTVMHEPRGSGELKDMFMDYIAGAYKTKYGSFGVSVNYNNMGKSEWTDDQGTFLGYLHSYGIAASGYWSYPLRSDLGLGVGFTYAYQHLTDIEGGSLGRPFVSFGALYKTPLKGLDAGLAFNHMWTDRKTDGLTYPAPRQARLGVSYKVLSTEKNDILVAADMSKLLTNFKEAETEDAEPSFDFSREISQAVYSGGLEYTFAKMVSVRGGYYYDFYGVLKGMTLGVGFSYRGFGFDYSRIPEGDLFGEQNRFGVSYSF